jgi:hypothetical protein
MVRGRALDKNGSRNWKVIFPEPVLLLKTITGSLGLRDLNTCVLKVFFIPDVELKIVALAIWQAEH